MVCDNCALRLYNTKSYNLQGVGNPFYGNCIVVPNVDYKAYKGKSMDFSSQVEIIRDVLNSSTGEEESNFYIVPLIRCNEQISCEVDDKTIENCVNYLVEDIRKYKFKNILLLGTSAKRILNCNNITDCVNTLFYLHGMKLFVNYSPFVKYTDNKLFEEFKEGLIKWKYSIESGFYEYTIKIL